MPASFSGYWFYTNKVHNNGLKEFVVIEPSELEAYIKERERRAWKAGQASICGRCGDQDCYHNKNPHRFEEYEASDKYED